jgi:hypothetical protein
MQRGSQSRGPEREYWACCTCERANNQARRSDPYGWMARGVGITFSRRNQRVRWFGCAAHACVWVGAATHQPSIIEAVACRPIFCSCSSRRYRQSRRVACGPITVGHLRPTATLANRTTYTACVVGEMGEAGATTEAGAAGMSGESWARQAKRAKRARRWKQAEANLAQPACCIGNNLKSMATSTTPQLHRSQAKE